MKKKMSSRRKFIKHTGLAAAAFTIVPRHVLGGKDYLAPSDKLNIAAIGAGGKGYSNIRALAAENIVALADVDFQRADRAFKEFPKAKRYKDYRIMLDNHPEIDAVMISTPDHTHAITGLACMEQDKHVYIEKPLAHSIGEVRDLTEMAAKKPHLITQMGNQGASGEGIRESQELYDAGLIGDVTKVIAWTNRPVWPQGGPIPTAEQPIPDHLDWNLWLGPAAMRPYNEAYLPFAWRGFWDFGTGALGDMGCHILDTPFYMLKLGYPIAAEASVGQVYSQNWTPDYNPGACPPSSKIHIKFPARDNLPPVELEWMDGGILPKRPEELSPDEPMGASGGGFILEGTKGKLMANLYGENPRLLPTTLMESIKVEPTIPRLKHSHQEDWAKGIKNSYQPSSHFGKAGPLTETVLMGNLAIRSYNYRQIEENGKYTLPGRTTLLWDGKMMKVTNLDFANQFVRRQSPRNF